LLIFKNLKSLSFKVKPKPAKEARINSLWNLQPLRIINSDQNSLRANSLIPNGCQPEGGRGRGWVNIDRTAMRTQRSSL